MSIILAMDTSGPSLSVALMREGTVVFDCMQQNGRTHSESLMTLVDMALETARIRPADVDCFAVVAGPGSFTGVRIGVTTAKSLAHATGKPCIGINALEALAVGVPFFGGIVCAMQDARAGQVYCAAYKEGTRVMEDTAIKLEDALGRLDPDTACCFVGDGAVAHREAIAARLGERAIFAPAANMAIDAAVAAALAEGRLDTAGSWETLAPYYLRAPQAERERLAREAAQHA